MTENSSDKIRGFCKIQEQKMVALYVTIQLTSAPPIPHYSRSLPAYSTFRAIMQLFYFVIFQQITNW